MRTIEVLSAVIAEELMARNTLIHLDPEEICWPDGNVTKPPSNETKRVGERPKRKIRTANMEFMVKLYTSTGSRAL